MLLKAFDCFFDNFLLIVEQAQLQERICLRRLISLLIGNVEQLLKMLNSFLYVSVFRVRLGKLFVRFSLF